MSCPIPCCSSAACARCSRPPEPPQDFSLRWSVRTLTPRMRAASESSRSRVGMSPSPSGVYSLVPAPPVETRQNWTTRPSRVQRATLPAPGDHLLQHRDALRPVALEERRLRLHDGSGPGEGLHGGHGEPLQADGGVGHPPGVEQRGVRVDADAQPAAAATPKPTRNMSRPLTHTPRPVKKLRAAPTAKWHSMAIVKAVQAAVGPVSMRNGATGMNAPMAVAAPVTHPSLRGVACASPIFSSSRTCSPRRVKSAARIDGASEARRGDAPATMAASAAAAGWPGSATSAGRRWSRASGSR